MRDGAKLQFARSLRQQMTDAERLLWYHLRNRQLMGAKFRRQHPLGPFVVDFVSLEARLIVEVDGSQHAAGVDAARTRFLERRGFRMQRFWNHDVLVRTEQVLEAIHAAIAPSVSNRIDSRQAGAHSQCASTMEIVMRVRDEQAGYPKRAANLSVNAALLDEAKALQINLSATLEKALEVEVRARRRERWLEENREAIEGYNVWVAENGVFSPMFRKR